MSREKIVERLKFARGMYITIFRGNGCLNAQSLAYWGGECLVYRKMLDKIDGKQK